MPKEQQQKAGVSRQRPVSCGFCRVRKLRCSRDIPCSNCVARRQHCDLEDAQQPIQLNAASNVEVLQRLERLEKLLNVRRSELDKTARESLNVSTRQDQFGHLSPVSPEIQSLNSDVAWLESIYSAQNLSHGGIPLNKVVIKFCSLHEIGRAQPYIYPSDSLATTTFEPVRCIWLPRYEEAQVFLKQFLRVHHHLPWVIHAPSVSNVVDSVYSDLTHQRQAKPGQIILLLSILASAAHSWIYTSSAQCPFPNPTSARHQAATWIKAAEDLLDITHRVAGISIEGVQGIIFLIFVLIIHEGVTRRTRSLFSHAILLAHQLDLHCIDHPSNAPSVISIDAEVGRRVWWYICTTDWTISARFNGRFEGVYSCHPRQMMTHKPLHINDSDLSDTSKPIVDRPLSEPTTMSYSVWRTRLSELARNLVDRNPPSMAHLGGLSSGDIMDIDTQIQILINEIPPFFSMPKSQLMEAYKLSEEAAIDFSQQGNTLRFLTNSQRCKLHLPYLTRGLVDPAFSTSRQLCIRSARDIIQSQAQLDRSIDLVGVRCRFGGLLVGVFMASIVLLMDLCINKHSPEHESRKAEVAEAFRILDAAKNESETTAKFIESLMQITRKHKIPPPAICKQQQPELGIGRIPLSQSASNGRGGLTGPHNLPISQSCDLAQDIPYGGDSTFAIQPDNNFVMDNLTPPITGEEISYFNEIAQTFELGNVASFDWDNIFSDLDASFI